MPNYDYKCHSCGHEQESFNRMNECRTNAPTCCGEGMDIIIKQAPMGFVDRPIEYICPVTSTPVTTRRQRNEIMKREGLVDANDLVNSKTIKDRAKKHEEKQAWIDKHRGPKQLQEYALKQAMR